MTATIETSIVLSCDEPGCKNTYPGQPDQPMHDVRKDAARALGWTYLSPMRYKKGAVPEADYCRAHSAG